VELVKVGNAWDGWLRVFESEVVGRGGVGRFEVSSESMSGQSRSLWAVLPQTKHGARDVMVE